MIFTQKQVWESVKKIAPEYKLDPYLVMAIAEQECQKDKEGNYDPSVTRLEQGFYARYTRDRNDSSTAEVLLANSWGVFQVMGLSLFEMGYFKDILTSPMLGLVGARLAPWLDAYCVDLDLMTHSACKWFTAKLKLSEGKVGAALLRWNGGSNPQYDDEVFARASKLKARLK